MRPRSLLCIRLTPLLLLILSFSSVGRDGPEEMRGFMSAFGKLEVERQKAVNVQIPPETIYGDKQHGITEVVWCGNQTLVSSGGVDTSAVEWDMARETIRRILPRPSASRIIACSKSGSLFATGGTARYSNVVARIWDISKRDWFHDVERPNIDGDEQRKAQVRNLVFDSSRPLLYIHFVINQTVNQLVAYDSSSWKVVKDFKLQGGVWERPALDSSGHFYAYISSPHVVVVDTANGRETIRIVTTKKLHPKFLAFGLDSQSIFVGGKKLYDGPHDGLSEQIVNEYSLIDGKLLGTTVTGHIYDLTGLEYRQDLQQLITSSSDKTIEIRDARSGQLVTVLGDKKSAVFSFVMKPNGAQIASASGRAMNVWPNPGFRP